MVRPGKANRDGGGNGSAPQGNEVIGDNGWQVECGAKRAGGEPSERDEQDALHDKTMGQVCLKGSGWGNIFARGL